MKSLLLILSAMLWSANVAAEEPVVVIANRDAAVDKISPERATQIFLKQVQSWPDGRAIQPIDLKEGSPLRAEFYAKVTGRSPGQLRAYWARQSFTGMGLPPKQVASAEDVSRLVQSTPGAIGYVGRKQAAGTAVRVVLDPAE
jgi:ABC-type phosphate transport system substrate-binding protein